MVNGGRNTSLALIMGNSAVIYRRYSGRLLPQKSFAATMPVDNITILSQAPDFVADDADEPAIGLAVPAKGLAAFQRGGEREIRNVD